MTGLYRTDTQAADELLQLLFPDLTPDDLRTDGGNVNMPKVRALLRDRAELEASRLPLAAPASPIELPQLPEPEGRKLKDNGGFPPTIEPNGQFYEHQMRQFGQQCYEAGVRAHAWQPIETAPKDGSEIWAAQADTPECGVILWDAELNQWSAPAEEFYEPNWLPTHWMPLPAQPAIRKG